MIRMEVLKDRRLKLKVSLFINPLDIFNYYKGSFNINHTKNRYS